MQRSPSIFILGIHIRTLGNKQFCDFLMTVPSRPMQRSPTVPPVFSIHIRTLGNKQFCDFLMTFPSRTMQRKPSPHIHRIHVRTVG